MAHFSGTFFSRCMSRPVHFTAVLANDNAGDVSQNPHYGRPAKSVYLLHGYSGCDTDWFANAPLQDFANRFNVNFFMPNGDNSFYLDQKETGFKYCSYVGQEIVEYTRKTFRISDRREDTYIGGLSMGGFGALHTGLTFPETFSKIFALSSALIVGALKYMKPENGNPMANYEYYKLIFGDLENAENTDINPLVLAKKLKDAGAEIPDIYMACGTEDFLIQPNMGFKAELDKLGVPVTFVTDKGIHDFVFWRAQLEAGLKWALEK